MSLKGKLALVLIMIVAITAALSIWVALLVSDHLLGWLVIVAAALLPVVWLASRIMRPIQQMLRALAGTVASYREGDFSLWSPIATTNSAN